MALFALKENVWDPESILYDSVEPPIRHASPYFFILGKNSSLNDVLNTNQHFFLEVGAYQPLEASLEQLVAHAPDFALCMTTHSAYYSGMAHAVSLVLNQRFGFLSYKSMEIETCLQEAIMNAIVHGNLGIESGFSSPQAMESYFQKIKDQLEVPLYKNKRITVTASEYNDHITIGVSDQGEGFSIGESVIEHTRPHGRGVLLMRSMADKVWVEKERRTVFMSFKY